MASLLNLIQMQQNPAAGLLGMGRQQGLQGLLGNAPAPQPGGPVAPPPMAQMPQAPPMQGPPMQGGPGGPMPGGGGGGAPAGDGLRQNVGAGITALMGGAPDPDLTPEQNEARKRHAYITAGLAMLADKDGGIGAIGRGILAGRGESERMRDKTLAENEARLQKLREEQIAARRQQVWTEFNPLSSEGRMQAAARYLSQGDLDTAEHVLKVDAGLAGLDARQQGEMIAAQIEADTDPTDMSSLLRAAGRFATAGMTDRSDALKSVVDSARQLEDFYGELTWRDTGDAQVAFDRNGVERMRLANNLTPYQRERLALDYAKMAAAETSGASEDYLKNLNTAIGLFRQDAQDYIQIAALSGAVREAGQNTIGDTALIYNFNKLLDLGGRVTDAEVQIALNAGGVLNRMLGLQSRLGGELTPTVRAQLLAEVETLSRNMQAAYEANVVRRYEEYARVAQLNPAHFMYDPFNPGRFQTPRPAQPTGRAGTIFRETLGGGAGLRQPMP